MTNTDLVRFIRDGSAGDFASLALTQLMKQAMEHVAGSDPEWSDLASRDHGSWQAIPPIQASALARQTHLPAETEIIAAAMQALWRELIPTEKSPTLLLAETEGESPTEAFSLAARQITADGSLTHPVAGTSVDTLAVRSWLAARQRGGHPATIILSTGLADRLGRFLERRRLRFRLPAGSRLVSIGTLAELRDEDPRSQTSIVEYLGLTPNAVQHVVSVPSLTTPLQVRAGDDGSLTLAAPPHWVRYRLPLKESEIDPQPRGDRLAVVDLATTRFPACQEIALGRIGLGNLDQEIAAQD